MDNSTTDVTLFAVFINDILDLYKNKPEIYEDLAPFTKGYDLYFAQNKIPIQVYNNMCKWIEDNLGRFNLIHLGRKIGETAYDTMISNKFIDRLSTPKQIMEALVQVAAHMIQDPKGRGWEIVAYTDNAIQMKRTQTFNGRLQFGLLDGLIKKSNVMFVEVKYLQNVEEGAEFDIYEITWKNR
ncbi:MAG: hypothetical protein EAZ97_06410 [Bacteroidetes bacterium]|nr:MAG: hypothetical protein EAZ97_06410 [Bacteroidota bacterium]